jgi:hypothetical protein
MEIADRDVGLRELRARVRTIGHAEQHRIGRRVHGLVLLKPRTTPISQLSRADCIEQKSILSIMATPTRVSDRSVVAAKLRETADQVLETTDAGQLVRGSTIEVRLRRSDLDLALACDARRLSFEVAALLVEAATCSTRRTWSLGSTGTCRIHGHRFRTGSVFARFSVDPRTPTDRKQLLSIVAVGLGIAALIIPPLAVPARAPDSRSLHTKFSSPTMSTALTWKQLRRLRATCKTSHRRSRSRRLSRRWWSTPLMRGLQNCVQRERCQP